MFLKLNLIPSLMILIVSGLNCASADPELGASLNRFAKVIESMADRRVNMGLLDHVNTESPTYHNYTTQLMIGIIRGNVHNMSEELAWATRYMQKFSASVNEGFDPDIDKAAAIIAKATYMIRIDEVDPKWSSQFYGADEVKIFHDCLSDTVDNLPVTKEECARLPGFNDLPKQLQELLIKENLLKLAKRRNNNVQAAQKNRDAAFSTANMYFKRPAFVKYTELDGKEIPFDIDLQNFINQLFELYSSRDPYRFAMILGKFLCGAANLVGHLIIVDRAEYAAQLNRFIIDAIMPIFVMFRYHQVVPYMVTCEHSAKDYVKSVIEERIESSLPIGSPEIKVQQYALFTKIDIPDEKPKHKEEKANSLKRPIEQVASKSAKVNNMGKMSLMKEIQDNLKKMREEAQDPISLVLGLGNSEPSLYKLPLKKRQIKAPGIGVGQILRRFFGFI